MSDDNETIKETRVHSGSRAELRAMLLDAGHGDGKADDFLDDVAPLTRDNPADIEFGEEVKVMVRVIGGQNVVFERTCMYAINTKTGQRLNYPCGPWVSQGAAGPDEPIDLVKPDRPRSGG